MARIAFLLPDFRVGGAERVALTLIGEFVGRGIEVDLVLLRAEGALLEHLPARVNVVSLNAARFRHAIRPLADYLRRRQPDAVQVRMWPLTLVAIVSRAIARSNCRVVVSDHGILSQHYANRGPLHRLFLRASIAFFYPFADARIAVSNGAARDLAMLGRLDRKSIDVVYNPIPLRTPKDNVDIDWGGEGARILAVGSLAEAKNYPLLLNAFAKFAATRPARLIILGEGPLRPMLEELSRTLGIADQVSMPGEVPDPAPYYASTQVMALTSDHEGFGNVLVEALHQGTTVVSTDCPSGPNEILDGGRFGYLVPCGDVEALAEALGKACDAPFPAQPLVGRAELLSGPRIIEQYLSLLLPARSA